MAYASHRAEPHVPAAARVQPARVTVPGRHPTEVPPGAGTSRCSRICFPTLTPPAHAPPRSSQHGRRSAPARSWCSRRTRRPRSGRLPLSHIELLLDVWARSLRGARRTRRCAVRVSVREPRRRGRRHAAPSARADLRVSVRAADRGARAAAAAGSLRCARPRAARAIICGASSPTARARALQRRARASRSCRSCARYPYEVWIAPRRPAPSLADARRATSARDFARALKTVLLKYDGLWKQAVSRTSWCSTRRRPTARPHPEAHLHVEFYPAYRMPNRLKYLAGQRGSAPACSPPTRCPRTRPRNCRPSRCRLSSSPDRCPLHSSAFRPAADVEADAPGRVNLIGEHTDYNGGFVLPMAIPQRDPRRASAAAPTARSASASARFGTGAIARVRARRRSAAAQLGRLRPGLHAGAGSRPASRRRASTARSTRTCRSAAACRRARRSKSRSCAALRDAVRADARRCGDSRGSGAAGRERLRRRAGRHHGPDGVQPRRRPRPALFLDTRIAAAPSACRCRPTAALIVIDSGVATTTPAASTRSRRRECERGGAAARRRTSCATSQILRRVERCPTPLNRRARHVVTENARVLRAVAALAAGDCVRVGATVRRIPPLDARRLRNFHARDRHAGRARRRRPRCYGARLTGGGFGGSIVALTDAARARDVAAQVVASYARQTGNRGRCLVPE